MQIVRIHYREKTFYASIVDSQHLKCLNKALGLEDPIPLSEVQILPVVWPTKIVCVGLNYKAHAEELGKPLPKEPLLFLKPSSSIIGSGEAIVLPRLSERVDYEGELAVVIGQAGRNIREGEVARHIFGYTCANDVTARDLRAPNAPWLRSKGFDTFCPLGPWIETELDPSDVTVMTSVNGEVRQDGHTADLIFGLGELIEYCSAIMTLLPGDVILTGTPEGVGPLAAGDVVSVAISGIGELENPVVAE